MRSLLVRLPIQLRLALAFAGIVAVLLFGLAVAQRLVLVRALDAHTSARLHADAAVVAAAAVDASRALAADRGPLLAAGVSFAQVLDERGRVLLQTPSDPGTPVLSPAQLQDARERPRTFERGVLAGLDPPTRLYARPVAHAGRRFVVVVGGSLDTRNAAIHELGMMLLIGAPVALVLVSTAGYVLALAALRPVASMRHAAGALSASERIGRLPLPPARDEIRRLGETLNGMLGRIEEALRRERALVADVSHELRTPLAILTTELEVAAHPKRSPAELRDAVRSATEEVQLLTRISDDLLTLVQVDAAALPLQLEPLDAGALLEEVAQAFAHAAGELHRRLIVMAPHGLSLCGDAMRLRQAIGNLLTNALTHGAGTIVLEARRLDDAIELSVRDHGPGLPPAFIPLAFQRFARAERRRASGGAGLGLPIVLAIAEAHGGAAGIENDPEGGARAWLQLRTGEPQRNGGGSGANPERDEARERSNT